MDSNNYKLLLSINVISRIPAYSSIHITPPCTLWHGNKWDRTRQAIRIIKCAIDMQRLFSIFSIPSRRSVAVLHGAADDTNPRNITHSLVVGWNQWLHKRTYITLEEQ